MDKNDDKIKVVTLLYEEERDALQVLTLKSGRSMSGYIRYLVNEDTERNSD